MRKLAFSLLLLPLACGLAQATVYHKTGITHAIMAAQVANPNMAFYNSRYTAGFYACQDSFRVGVGDVFTFVPWVKTAGGAYQSFVAWQWIVAPQFGCVRVTAYPHARAIADTLTWAHVSPDSASSYNAVVDGTLIDSVRVRGLIASQGRARAR